MRSLRKALAGTRLFREFGELRRSWPQLLAPEDPLERRARYELAVSTRRFSKKAKEVVDDKLAFSATLMRAGEVEAASRLLEEVEQEVRDERAVLMGKVHEVKRAQMERRERMTRMRLARTLAVAVLGSTVMAFSAIGMSVASFIGDDEAGIAAPSDASDQALGDGELGNDNSRVHDGIRRIRIKGKSVILTKSDMKLMAQFANGAITQVSVQEILQLLPDDVARVIVATAARADKPAEEVAEVILKAMARNKKRKDRGNQPAQPPAAEPSPEPSQDPSPSPQPSPSSSESSEPSGNGGKSKKRDGKNHDGTGPGGSADGDEGPLDSLDGEDDS